MAPLSLKVVLAEGAVSKTVLFESGMRVAQAQAIVKEKVLTADDGKEYGLFLTSADDEGSGVWLEGDRNLEYYMLRDGDQLHYLCRIRNLRIRMLDGSVKTLQVDESKTVAELMVGICARIGITNHDEYGLCREDEEAEEKPAAGAGTLTRRAAPARERDHKLDQLSKKLKTDDNVEWLEQHRTLREQRVPARAPLLLRRRLFYTDRNVDARDPVGLTLLYVQTRNDILEGRHPVTEPQVVSMFTDRLDVRLICLVRDNPVLYDLNHPKYMDFNAREVAWQRIGDELKRPAGDCKVRWINIRDVNRRILKKNLTNPRSPHRVYKYEAELAFMKPFYKDVIINEFEADDKAQWDDDADEPCDAGGAADSDESEKSLKKVSKSNKKSKKRKKWDFEEEKPLSALSEPAPASDLDPADPVDAFLLSIGATLKTFSPYHLNLAKSKIFAVVQEHDLQQIVQKTSDVKNADNMYME